MADRIITREEAMVALSLAQDDVGEDAELILRKLRNEFPPDWKMPLLQAAIEELGRHDAIYFWPSVIEEVDAAVELQRSLT